ncbi:E3 SUMO-protein ligase ZBED1-like [Falco naumanni]|uniref:E3 SUMO-protein ligase ZBED1-like n=1 Tax=Falco naumanni TaxID=148594 RepID=UPI001ADE7BC4|nr:E3 SUMO-protein ligase ZBED1-like [Falco naumanni]
MAGAGSERAPQLPENGAKAEGEAQPKEEATEEPVLPLIPPAVPEENSMVFNAYAMVASKRKREKGSGGGGGQDGASAAFYVDRRKSKVWNYYTKLGDAYVECNVCKKQLSFHNSTTTMREHLVRKHSIRDTLLSQLRDDQSAESDSSAQENAGKRSRQMTPPENVYHAAPCSDPRSDIILELLLEMIFRDLHPLSVVKDKGFGLLVGYLEPNFALPVPAQLASMLRHRYTVMKRQLERYLQPAQAVVLCVELWPSLLGPLYRSVSACFIDGEWRRARCALETQPAPEGEGEAGEGLCAVLSKFGASGKAVFCVMRDAAADAAQPQGWSGLCCAARTLHRCVAAGLEVEQVREALGAARGIVRYFQQDAKATGSLNGKLEATKRTRLSLALDAEARWLSTAEMCESLLELKWAVMAVLEEHPEGAAAAPRLADGQWKLLQDLVGVLRTVRIAVAFLREEQNASISSLLPCVHGVAAAIGQQAEEAGTGAVIRTVVGNIRAELRRCWGSAEDEKVLENPAVIASFLDPRFKELRFLSPALRNELHQRVKTILSQISNPQAPAGGRFWTLCWDYKAEGGEGNSQPPAPKEQSASAAPQSPYDILLGRDPTESMPEIHQQLENYIVEPLCKRSTNPLDWWKNNEHRFPAVARLSRHFLAIPATATPPEQAFATGESALQHRRAGLAPENLDQILFLHQNFDFLDVVRRGNDPRHRALR